MPPIREDQEVRISIVIFNGQPSAVRGWYLDQHGHRLFLGDGELAPMCTQRGVGVSRWHLVQPLPEVPRPGS